MRALILTFLLFAFQGICQQKPEELLTQKIQNLDKKTKNAGNYFSEGKYHFFNSLQGNDTSFTSDYMVMFEKKRDLLNIRQMDQFIIQDENVMITIDTARKQVIINKPNPIYKKSMIGNDITETDKHISQITLDKEKNEEQYTLVFDKYSRIGKIKIQFSKEGLISKIISEAAYSVPDQSQGRDVMVQPRMEVKITNYQFGDKVKTETMKSIAAVYNVESKTLSDSYKEFQLIDLRYNPTNK
jgi:hypothetical protein